MHSMGSRLKKTKKTEKNKESILVAEAAYNSQNAEVWSRNDVDFGQLKITRAILISLVPPCRSKS